jgi:hypothetical protein
VPVTPVGVVEGGNTGDAAEEGAGLIGERVEEKVVDCGKDELRDGLGLYVTGGFVSVCVCALT